MKPNDTTIFFAYHPDTETWLPSFGYFVSAERARLAIQKHIYRDQKWNDATRKYEYTETVDEVEERRSEWQIVEFELGHVQSMEYKRK